MKSIVRKIIPRRIRNVIRSPKQAIDWWLNQHRKPVRLQIRKDFHLLCPRNAILSGYSHFQIDPEQTRELDHFISSIAHLNPPRLLDIGCHYGMFSLATLNYGGPDARVLGVDASKTAGDMFAKSMVFNNWSASGEFQHMAVGEKVGNLRLVGTGISGGNYFVQPEDHPESETTEIPMTTIDQLVNRLDWRPNVIKIDVEGFEGEVIQGGSVFLRSSSPLVCLEIHNQIMKDHHKDPAQVIRRLKDLGYNAFYSIENDPLTDTEILSRNLIRLMAIKK